MTGYWNKPEETAAAFREIDGRRYFLTGDIGHVDGDGYLLITDRKKDMILVNFSGQAGVSPNTDSMVWQISGIVA